MGLCLIVLYLLVFAGQPARIFAMGVVVLATLITIAIVIWTRLK